MVCNRPLVLSEGEMKDKTKYYTLEQVQIIVQEAQRLAVEKAHEDGVATGWNTAISFIERNYEPLMWEHVELESILGHISGIVISYPQPQPLPIQILRDFADQLSSQLGKVVRLNKEFGGRLKLDSYIDYTVATDIYEAITDYTAGNDKQGRKLRQLINDNPAKRRQADAMAALKKRKPKGRQTQVQQIGEAVANILTVQPALTVEKAAESALAVLGLEAYSINAAIQYYYRVKKDKESDLQLVNCE